MYYSSAADSCLEQNYASPWSWKTREDISQTTEHPTEYFSLHSAWRCETTLEHCTRTVIPPHIQRADKNTLKIHGLTPSPQGYTLTKKLSQPHILAGCTDKLFSTRQTFHVCVEDDTTHSQICYKNEHISCNFLPVGLSTHLATRAGTWQRGGEGM